jgi:hypothetical protein
MSVVTQVPAPTLDGPLFQLSFCGNAQPRLKDRSSFAPLKSEFRGQTPHLPIVISIPEAMHKAQGPVRAAQLRKGLNEP